MKFNAFDKITPCIDLTKKLLFPFNFKFWTRLGFTSFLAHNPGGFGSSSPSVFNVLRLTRYTANPKGFSTFLTANLFWLIPVGILMFLIGFFFQIITSIFTFVFIESIDTKKIQIKKSFKRNTGLGISLFLFRLVYGIIVLGVLALIWLPVILTLVKTGFQGLKPSLFLAGFFVFLLLLLVTIIVSFIFGIFYNLFINITVPHMYFTRQRAYKAIKETFKVMKKNPLETLVFYIARFVTSLLIGLIGIVAFIILMIPCAIIALPFGMIFYFIGSAIAWSTPFIVFLVIIGMAYMILWSYIMNVVLLPLTVFGRYFSITNYYALMRIKKR